MIQYKKVITRLTLMLEISLNCTFLLKVEFKNCRRLATTFLYLTPYVIRNEVSGFLKM